MTDEHLQDPAPDEASADTMGGSGLVENVKDLAQAAGAKLGDVAGSVGKALQPPAQAAGAMASTIGQAARDTAQTIADTVATKVSSVAANTGESEDTEPPDHSGGVPETGASVDAGHIQNLPGQGAGGRETM
jgi:hypothetical protein